MGAPDVIIVPALGQNVQLGMLYDARSSQLFAGLSLWDEAVVNKAQSVDERSVQNAEYVFSLSLDEARKNAGLDVESSLSLDLGFIKATGSAKYLNDSKSNAFEANVSVSCTVTRRTRRIPQETLASLKYEQHLATPRYTHFVAEVVEGGTATLNFTQSCSSEEEQRHVAGSLSAQLKSLSIEGSAKVDCADNAIKSFEKIAISYSGAIAESVATIADARRVAAEMPAKLFEQKNTLSFKLLPLSLLDSSVRSAIRELDATLVGETSAALKAGAEAKLTLQCLQQPSIFDQFPAIRKQIAGLIQVFDTAEKEYTQKVRSLLPALRDGSSDDSKQNQELYNAVATYKKRVKFAEQFVAAKREEMAVLQRLVTRLTELGFENHLQPTVSSKSNGHGGARLIVSLGGAIAQTKHPLHKRIKKAKAAHSSSDNGSGSSTSDDDDDSDGDDAASDEWFHNHQTMTSLSAACSAVEQQRIRVLSCGTDAPAVVFAFASVSKAIHISQGSKIAVSIGDIVLDNNGVLLLMTGYLPGPPDVELGKPTTSTVPVKWALGDGVDVLAPRRVVIQYSPKRNAAKDSPFSIIGDREQPSVFCVDEPRKGHQTLIDLHDDCDYEIKVCVETILGATDWSTPQVARTGRKPSLAAEMINFFLSNTKTLSARTCRGKPWEMTSDSRPTLYLGHSISSERHHTSGPNKELAVRIVDVASEFKREIPSSLMSDDKNTKILVFTGATGHGKSTQINAFLSYLLGGTLEDAARIMLIDDREARQSASVTQYITCYCIRPLSSLFEGKTLVIVDTPGFADVRGVERDRFTTAAMGELFKTISHVNAIVFTAKANEARKNILSPVSTYVFQLFAKEVASCLKTIYTYSDAGKPQARVTLKELSWPVENGEVQVNNAAFVVAPEESPEAIIRQWWNLSMSGQREVLNMLLRTPPVPTDASAQVTTDRLELERRCVLAEVKILQTANEAQNIILQLGSLASAVGASPNDKVEVTVTDVVKRDLAQGTYTTLCTVCNHTCHKVCAYSDDNDKKRCSAMRDGKCTMCKGKCDWSVHKNALFTIEAVARTTYVVSEDLIKTWNNNNVTLEGALLGAMDEYLDRQHELRNDILYLASLTGKLKKTALLHNPNALYEYVQFLIASAKAQGASAEQLLQLESARNALMLAARVDKRGASVARTTDLLHSIMDQVRNEMKRRMKLSHMQRVEEEKKPCNLYDSLYAQLPQDLKNLCGTPYSSASSSKFFGFFSSRPSCLYPDNLKRVVVLVQTLLKNGYVE